MAKRTTKRGTVLAGLPEQLERVQAEAEEAVERGVNATIRALPPRARKAVRELGAQVDETAADLRKRGRAALRVIEKRREAVAEQVDETVSRLEKRATRTLGRVERESEKWRAALATGARRVLHDVLARFEVASTRDVERLAKRIATLERKLAGRRRAA